MSRGDVTYRSSARQALVVVWLFRAMAAVGIFYVAASLWRLSQAEAVVFAIDETPPGLLFSTAALAVMAVVAAAIRLCVLVAFMMWLFRATKNLPALGVRDPDVTPGWAIGCWFVPFVNIIAPCIVILRVWRASDPTGLPGTSNTREGWPLLYGWWGAFLAMTAAGFATWFARDTGHPMFTTGQVWAYLCAGIASIVVALLAVRIVREIERRQTDKLHLQAFA
jgi:hypothetical protein